MNRIAYLLAACLALSLAGCQERLNIQGTTNIPTLEGRTLYLRVFTDGDLHTVDSARITHGRFQFRGAPLDSTVMAILFLDEESLMPVVVDQHVPLSIVLNESDHRVEGSALNDSLFAFIRRKTVLDEQLAALPRRESQMILDGYDHDEIILQLQQEAAVLGAQEDALVMRFIKDNMDNVLAPGVFMIVTSSLPYPMLNPQIEELVTLGSPTFLSDAYVSEYLRMARENMEKMNEE